jgi:MFS family permease
MIGLGATTLVAYGWALQQKSMLAGPLCLSFIIGYCMSGCIGCLSTLIVDLYPLSPATATAANNLIRCLIGAAGIAAINPMTEAIGKGWSFTFFALLFLAAVPLLLLEIRQGPKWREARRVRIANQQKKDTHVQGAVARD